jgi:hypothetical protein
MSSLKTPITHHITAAPALVGVVVARVAAGAGVCDLDDDRCCGVPAGALAVQPLTVACKLRVNVNKALDYRTRGVCDLDDRCCGVPSGALMDQPLITACILMKKSRESVILMMTDAARSLQELLRSSH